MPAFIRSSASAMARMSAAVPATSPEGSCSTSMAFSGMTISSPAIAIMLAIEAAMPSIHTVIAASWRFSAIVEGDAIEHRAARAVDPDRQLGDRSERLQLVEERFGGDAEGA